MRMKGYCISLKINKPCFFLLTAILVWCMLNEALRQEP